MVYRSATQGFFEHPLYRTIESLFPVIAERPQDDDLTWGNSGEFARKHHRVIGQRVRAGLFVVTREDVDAYSPCLAPETFVETLVPQNIWEDFEHEDKEDLGRRVVTTERFIVRTLEVFRRNFRVPDLEGLLVNMLERDDLPPLRVTAVRLPVEDDLATYKPRWEDYEEKLMMKSFD